jgi:hypothetical protein
MRSRTSRQNHLKNERPTWQARLSENPRRARTVGGLDIDFVPIEALRALLSLG